MSLAEDNRTGLPISVRGFQKRDRGVEKAKKFPRKRRRMWETMWMDQEDAP